ncbi:hypothetical protein BLNAU_7502 [Blattamonas nauphoetae]|uniref:Uncharacterized protein n=1 Tax=Blattamonas nauphoetae TaxID=2049346 RepID=A0ABQ9Y1I1_9EUKA|nr:hypothetical protein BLNAU_7502 [Blattamonas nauphoetae]
MLVVLTLPKWKKKARKNRRASCHSNLVEEEREERNGLSLNVVCILEPVVSVIFFTVSLVVCFVIFAKNIGIIDEILRFSLVQVSSASNLINTKIWHSFFSDLIVADPDIIAHCWYLDDAEINSERINSKKDFADINSKSIRSESNLDEFISDDDKSIAVSVKSWREICSSAVPESCRESPVDTPTHFKQNEVELGVSTRETDVMSVEDMKLNICEILHHQSRSMVATLSFSFVATPSLSLCSRQSSESLFVALADDTATDDGLSPHSSPKPTPTPLAGMTRLLLTDLSRQNTHGQGGVKTDRQNTDTSNLVACHTVSDVITILVGHTSHRRLRSLHVSVLTGDCKDSWRYWSPCRVNS